MDHQSGKKCRKSIYLRPVKRDRFDSCSRVQDLTRGQFMYLGAKGGISIGALIGVIIPSIYILFREEQYLPKSSMIYCFAFAYLSCVAGYLFGKYSGKREFDKEYRTRKDISSMFGD